MTTPTFRPANLQWLGLAKEATPGTAESAPDFFVPITSPKWSPKINPLTDQAMRGLMGVDYQQIAGMRYEELSYTTYPYMDSVYQHFLATFGTADAITGTADPVTHKTSLYNGDSDAAQPPSFTGFYFDGGTCRQIPGMKIASVKLDVKVDELATIEVTWNGLPSTAMVTAPTNTPTTDKPMPSWNSIISLAGAASSRYSEVSLTYTRDTKPLPTINNSQTPVAIYAGALSVAGSLNAVYAASNSDPDLADYIANTQPALSVKMAPAGDTTHSLELKHSVVAYDDVEPTSGDDWMTVASTIKCLMNATDALDSLQSPGQAIFISADTDAF